MRYASASESRQIVLFRSHRWFGEMWFERRVVSRELGKCFYILRYMEIFLGETDDDA